ncbi:hypothetical protein GCM10028808_40980 [Spirosoma migulaei]
MGKFPANNVVGAGGPNGPGTYYSNFHTVFGIKGLTSDRKSTSLVQDKPIAVRIKLLVQFLRL